MFDNLKKNDHLRASWFKGLGARKQFLKVEKKSSVCRFRKGMKNRKKVLK